MHTDKIPDDAAVLCQKRSLLSLLLSPMGIVLLLFAPLTLGGLPLLVLGIWKYSFPGQVWLIDGELHATGVGYGGAPLHQLVVEVTHQTLLLIPISRVITVFVSDEFVHQRLFSMNGLYYRSGDLGRFLDAVSQ